MNDTQGCEEIAGFMIGFISAERTGLYRSTRTWNERLLSPNFTFCRFEESNVSRATF